MSYGSTKTYGHEQGFSCCFRQHRAKSHCRHLHGYALAIRFEFEADHVDGMNWVVDFGGMKDLKAWLASMFDHTVLVAVDDPQKDEICALAGLDVASVVVVEATGCEMFAKLIYDYAFNWLKRYEYGNRIRLRSVEVREHAGNSASYSGARK